MQWHNLKTIKIGKNLEDVYYAGLAGYTGRVGLFNTSEYVNLSYPTQHIGGSIQGQVGWFSLEVAETPKQIKMAVSENWQVLPVPSMFGKAVISQQPLDDDSMSQHDYLQDSLYLVSWWLSQIQDSANAALLHLCCHR